MKVTLHMAVSKDGYIAKADGDSDWVSKIDEDLFKERVQKAGCVVIGKRTFDQYHGSIYPIPGALNIVLSNMPGSDEPNVVYAGSPTDALAIASKSGHNEVIISGGAKTSAAFLREGLLDDVYLTTHPIVLGNGIKLFDGLEHDDLLQLTNTRELGEDLVEMHYRVID